MINICFFVYKYKLIFNFFRSPNDLFSDESDFQMWYAEERQ